MISCKMVVFNKSLLRTITKGLSHGNNERGRAASWGVRIDSLACNQQHPASIRGQEGPHTACDAGVRLLSECARPGAGPWKKQFPWHAGLGYRKPIFPRSDQGL